MDSGSSRLVVLPRAGGGYELRETPTGPVLAKPYTKTEALRQAAVRLEGRGGQIVLVSAHNSPDQVFVVESAGPRPRWYFQPTVVRWLIPSLLVTQLLLRLVIPWGGPLQVVLTVLIGLVCVAALACLFASIKVDRSRRPRPADPTESRQD